MEAYEIRDLATELIRLFKDIIIVEKTIVKDIIQPTMGRVIGHEDVKEYYIKAR